MDLNLFDKMFCQNMLIQIKPKPQCQHKHPHQYSNHNHEPMMNYQPYIYHYLAAKIAAKPIFYHHNLHQYHQLFLAKILMIYLML
ncbi:MAG: hypothetical protein EBU12_05875 [Microbacteriaceae bacterium]|nr:hypothetical protein [Microbacteriaceae bacterium]